MRKHFVMLLCLLGFFIISPAFGQTDFTDMVTFGDSLTHNDLLGWVYGNPQDMYGKDAMESAFSKGASTGDELTNYAVAGSESDHVEIQVYLYEFFKLIGLQDKATLIGFEIGGNDILNNIDLLAHAGPGEYPAADAVIDNLLTNMRKDLLRLYQSHPEAQFILWTLPDVTLTPRLWYDLTEIEVANVQAHIKRINRSIRSLRRNPSFIVFDLYTLMPLVINSPPSFFDHQIVPPPDYGDYDHLFADEIHPTAVSNGMMANIMIRQINKKWGDSISLYSEEELADLARIPY